MSRIPRLPSGSVEKHALVLMDLAKNGPSTKYQIEKKILPRIDHATLHKIVLELKRSGSIRVVDRGRSRAGLTMEYYDLTLPGMIGAIQHDDRLSRRKKPSMDEVLKSIQRKGNRIRIKSKPTYELDLDVLARKYASYLPLIFGKWEFLKKIGLDPNTQLRSVSWTTFNWPIWFPVVVQKDPIPWSTDWLDKVAMPTPRYAMGFNRAMEKPDSKQAVKMLEAWERYLRDSLYLNFFNITIAEYAWQGPKEILAGNKAESSKFDRLLGLDPEICDWMRKAMANLASSYSKRAEWYCERSKQLDRTRASTLKMTSA